MGPYRANINLANRLTNDSRRWIGTTLLVGIAVSALVCRSNPASAAEAHDGAFVVRQTYARQGPERQFALFQGHEIPLGPNRYRRAKEYEWFMAAGCT